MESEKKLENISYEIEIVSKKKKRQVYLLLSNNERRSLFRIINVGPSPQLRYSKKEYHGALFDEDKENLLQMLLMNKLYFLILKKQIQDGKFFYHPFNTSGPVICPLVFQEEL